MINMATQPDILDKTYSAFYQRNAILSYLEDSCFKPEITSSAFIIKTPTDDNTEYAQKLVCNTVPLPSLFLFKDESPTIENYSNITTESETMKHYNMISLLTHKIERFRNWSDEDILIGPTDNVLDTVKEIIPELVVKNLIPFRITPSIEEGLCLVFRKSNIIAYVEYYNDGDIGLIAEDSLNKNILINIDLEENNILHTLNDILG